MALLAGDSGQGALRDAVMRAVRVLEDAGCDFMELPVAAVAPEGPDAAFEPLRRGLATTHLMPESFNSFLPRDMRLVGPERNPKRVDAYVRAAFRRIAELGGEIVVFGSGGARNVPDSYPRDKAEAELMEFVGRAADHARAAGIRMAIEPLNRAESNVLNSLHEADAMARGINRSEIGVVVDLFHHTLESEPFEHIPDAAGRLIHVHVADTARGRPGTGTFDYPGFCAALKQAGYDARVSAECRWHDFAAEVTPSMEFMRQAW